MEAYGKEMTGVAQQFAMLNQKLSTQEYNYQHFQTHHLLNDMQRTTSGYGIQPGAVAPNFELPRAEGGSLRLSDLQGKPVLLHFGSLS